jgi:hypothetical protein
VSTDTPEVTTDPRVFRALAMLEKQYPPLYNGFEPLWRAPQTPARIGNVLTPSWNWTGSGEIAEEDTPVTLDINAAFLSAAGAVEVSRSQLIRKGPIDAHRIPPRFETNVWPGYYRIVVPPWKWPDIVSPLGNGDLAKVGTQVWIAHPTLVLLLEMLETEYLGELQITDAWVSNKRCNFRDWTKALRAARMQLLDQRDKADTDEAIEAAKLRYKMFKQGYGSAFSMMLTGKGCHTKRPDWAHAVYAMHAATAWRKVWRVSAIGPVLWMGEIDAFTIGRQTLAKAVTKAPTPPLKLDPTGRLHGYVKEKKHEPTVDAPGVDDILYSDDFEDLF